MNVRKTSDFFLEEADGWRGEAWEIMRRRSDMRCFLEKYLGSGQIGQVICGGENYDGTRPCDFEWIKGLRRECEAYGVTFCYIETGTNFIKDGRRYYLLKKPSRAGWRLNPGWAMLEIRWYSI